MAGRGRSTWVPGADGSGFGIENLPYGVVRRRDGRAGSPAVRVGDYAVDLAALAGAGLLDVAGLSADTFAEPSLGRFVRLGDAVWSATRARLTALLDAGGDEAREECARALVRLDDVEPVLPLAFGDFVDFYSSREHATNVGRLLRPGREPLAANWRRLPVAYHGRAGSIVVSGTPVRRPWGQRAPGRGGEAPAFGPEPSLDFEVELGFVTGRGPAAGDRIPVTAAASHIFGFLLVNDWSARQIQRFEYEPLGPFLGKSFATSVSSWIVSREAVDPLWVAGVEQDPPPPEHLRAPEPRSVDVELSVAVTPAGDSTETRLSRVNARDLYWSPAQQLAHATVGGATVRPGDLFASGAISGPGSDQAGSLLELTGDGRRELTLAGGARRRFLEDGDTVVISGCGPTGGGRGPAISFGEVRGTIAPATGPP